jgi:propionate CoA-transferase
MKIVTAEEAAALIQDRWMVTIAGFGHCGVPEALLAALERRFLNHGSPRRLSMMFASGAGDRGSRGINRLAHEGLLSMIIGGFWSLAPRLGEMVRDNKIQAYNWPQGVVSHMYRAIAGGLPGVITTVGLGTFIEPRLGGGRLNETTVKQRIELIEIGGRDFLLYKAPRLNCALLRGSTADGSGNVTLEKEANFQDVLAQAQAVKNSDGIVVVQVQKLVADGELSPQAVKIPGVLVDYVVMADQEHHWQTYGEQFNPSYCETKSAVEHVTVSDLPQGAKRIIARRAMLELLRHARLRKTDKPLVVNLGIGVPEGIAVVASRDGLLDQGFVLSVESGAIGGYPAGGNSFGATSNPQAILNQSELFDFYNGGGIDIAFLGYGEIDKDCRINVSGLGHRINGVGGFVNISQSAKALVFCGTFTASGLMVSYSDAMGLQIESEGAIHKMVQEVAQICYDPRGQSRCRTPLLITERAVFKIHRHSLEMVELAPGCTLVRDITPHMDIPITISKQLKLMPVAAFNTEVLAPPQKRTKVPLH